MLTLILFILLLSLIVVVHEFGHLIVAKMFGVYCHEFSIGMGPAIVSKKGKETTYSIRAFPLGGFVAMAGDSDNALETSVDVEVPYERTLLGIAPYKKILIMLAGIFMNILLAIFIIAMVFLFNKVYAVAPDTTIASIQENSPAYEAGLMPNDYIVSLSMGNGISSRPKDFNDLLAFIVSYDGNGPITFEVKRGDELLNLEVYPTYNTQEERYVVGIGASESKVVNIDIFNCWYYAIDYACYVIRTIFMSLTQLIRGFGLQNLSGPVGIYRATDQAISMGMQSYFLMLAIISLNIGIFNALPLPIMDGGRVLITIVEMIIGHPISKKFESALMGASVLLLLVILVFATYQDILRLF